jgi:hypothetical protein
MTMDKFWMLVSAAIAISYVVYLASLGLQFR